MARHIYVDGTPKGRVAIVTDTGFSKIINVPNEITNNEAEYISALKAFDYIDTNDDWIIHMDSKLVVMQASGLWKCRANNIRPYLEQLRYYIDNFPRVVTLEWIGRDDNPAGVLLDNFKDIENDLDKEMGYNDT